MKVFHGTSRGNLERISEEGIDYPSYWTNDIDQARKYADSHGNGVVISVDTERYDFKANMLVAQCLLDDDEIDKMPNENDLAFSLEYLEGIVCHERIRDFDVEVPSVRPPKP